MVRPLPILAALPAVIAVLITPLDSRARQTTVAQRGSHPGAVDAKPIDREVRADMGFLADDALRGRGSATRDEHIAALYAAAQFESLGLEPGADGGGFVQKIVLTPEQRAAAQKRMAQFEQTDRNETWNAIGILRGRDATAGALVLSAHLDHLGVGPANAAGDTIYNGADDDASGTTAVLV